MKSNYKQEIMHMLQISTPIPDIVRSISAQTCPYRQEALAIAPQHCWREMENTFDERAVYQIGEQWKPTWPNMQETIHYLLKRAKSAQQKTSKPIRTKTTNTIVKPIKKTTTMPIIIQKQEGTIHNYDHCTFYTSTPVTTKQTQEIEDVQAIPPFFRTDTHSIVEIEKQWQKALEEPTKTKVIRFVLRHDYTNGYFRLGELTNQRRAEEFNKAQNKFQFNANDFENANRK